MNTEAETGTSPAAGLSRWQRIGPIVTLLLLSPVIGEVMSGSTRLSYIFALVPEIMVWGCGTLIIREVVRRWQGGWTSLLLLGFGLSVAEEFIIQQTSIAPLPWAGAASVYGRVWGVNWPYFLFMLGYEAVWRCERLAINGHRGEGGPERDGSRLHGPSCGAHHETFGFLASLRFTASA